MARLFENLPPDTLSRKKRNLPLPALLFSCSSAASCKRVLTSTADGNIVLTRPYAFLKTETPDKQELPCSRRNCTASPPARVPIFPPSGQHYGIPSSGRSPLLTATETLKPPHHQRGESSPPACSAQQLQSGVRHYLPAYRKDARSKQ